MTTSNYNYAVACTNTLQENLRIWNNGRFRYEEDSDNLLILEDLCQRGADLNHLEKERGFGCIPNVFWCKRLIRFFLDRGADVNSKDHNGDTALHLVIRHANFDGTGNMELLVGGNCPDNNPKDIIKFLLQQTSADPNLTNLRKETAFHTLTKNKSYQFLGSERAELVSKLFVARRRVCDNPDEAKNEFYSQTPLMVAAKELEFCKRLIADGATLNDRDVQGYTALHHALLEGATECAEFLVNAGADTSPRSQSGRDCFDVAISGSHVFTCGATPKKKAEIYEIVGAIKILRGYLNCHWDEAMNVYNEFDDLQPSPEFSANYEFLTQNRNVDLLYDSAVETITRLSSDEFSRFWNIVSCAAIGTRCDFFRILNTLSPELNRVEEFASFEQRDILSLFDFVMFFDFWIKKASEETMSDQLITPERISYLHSIAKLVLACFKKIIEKTKCSKIEWHICIEIYVSLCRVLTRVHSIIPATQLKENEQHLRQLVEMDIRDRDSNTLLHLVIKRGFGPDLVSVLVDFVDDVKVRNEAGFEPCQLIDWGHNLFRQGKNGTGVLAKMAAKGAHVDARCQIVPFTLEQLMGREKWYSFLFPHDNLQCACARVLASNLIPYRDRVPKLVVDFINSHK